MAVKIPNYILAFVYFANFFLLLLQLQVAIIIQAHISFCRWFQLLLDSFSSFQIVLGRFSLFLTLVSTVRCYYSYNLRLLHELRDTNLSYLSKNKKDFKKFVLQFALKFLINISFFDREARGCAFLFVENFLKTNKR